MAKVKVEETVVQSDGKTAKDTPLTPTSSHRVTKSNASHVSTGTIGKTSSKPQEVNQGAVTGGKKKRKKKRSAKSLEKSLARVRPWQLEHEEWHGFPDSDNENDVNRTVGPDESSAADPVKKDESETMIKEEMD